MLLRLVIAVSLDLPLGRCAQGMSADVPCLWSAPPFACDFDDITPHPCRTHRSGSGSRLPCNEVRPARPAARVRRPAGHQHRPSPAFRPRRGDLPPGRPRGHAASAHQGPRRGPRADLARRRRDPRGPRPRRDVRRARPARQRAAPLGDDRGARGDRDPLDPPDGLRAAAARAPRPRELGPHRDPVQPGPAPLRAAARGAPRPGRQARPPPPARRGRGLRAGRRGRRRPARRHRRPAHAGRSRRPRGHLARDGQPRAGRGGGARRGPPRPRPHDDPRSRDARAPRPLRMAGRRTAPATIPLVTAPDSRRWLGPALTAASLVLLALVILLVPDVRQAAREAISGNTDDLKELLNGVDAAAILLVLMLMHAVVWYPAEIIMVTAGFAYGFWLALPLMMVGWTLSAMLSYEIGAHVAGPV